MSKRILLIADAASFWTERYIRNLLLPDGWEIVLFPIWDADGKYTAYYRQNGITLYHDTHTLPGIRHIPRLRMWARIALNTRALIKLGPFDAIHNQYLSQRDLELGYAVRRAFPAARWVCSFLGSDLLRASPLALRRMRRSLTACDAVTVHSSLHFGRIRDAFGDAVALKTALVFFGQNVFQDIDNLRAKADQATCKAHFGLSGEKPLICLGYNAGSSHRHLELLAALRTLPAETLMGWSLVLQMTYGLDNPEYLQRVREAAAAMPCQTLILTDFMDGPESAYLRLAADAFVLAIPTDAFSASMQEYLYAGSRVLRASWLHYPQLDELGIKTATFDDIAQVPALLVEALQTELTAEETQNRARLEQKYSWAAVGADWRKLYETASVSGG
jgi:glycosyltransferase involved in cell wall biosynthesis